MWLSMSLLSGARIGIALAALAVGFLGMLVPRTKVWLPQRAAQVSSELIHTGRTGRMSFGWGFELGVGVRTFLVTPAFYGLFAVALAQRTPLIALGIGVAYGASRGAALAVMTLASREPSHRVAAILRTDGVTRLMRVPLLVILAATFVVVASTGTGT